MRIGFRVVCMAFVLSACGARSTDNHTGGKTSWLSACVGNDACSGLEGSVCVNHLCTKTCEDTCGLENTTCTPIFAQSIDREQAPRVCLPDCVEDRDCASFGSGYACEMAVCVHEDNSSSVTFQDPEASSEPIDSRAPASSVDVVETMEASTDAGTDIEEPVQWLREVEAWERPAAGQAPEGTPVAAHGWLRVEGTNLVNSSGVPVQLRGVSSMWLNWDTGGYATSSEAMKFMRDNWDLMVFRAAMGVEEDGGYLASPLARTTDVRRIIQNAIDLGVYVLVDWHAHEAHLSLDKSKDFFAEIAAEFGEYPNVVYEPFNEPLHPNSASWVLDIKPYHEAIIPVIRERAPDSIVILGTPEWSSGVDEAARAPVVGSNLMYTLHFSSCSHAEELRQAADVALALGAPLFVTEWAATTDDGGVNAKTVCSAEAMLWHEWMDARNISWIAWKLDRCSDASCILGGRASAAGGWGDEELQGHGAFVRERLLAPSVH